MKIASYFSSLLLLFRFTVSEISLESIHKVFQKDEFIEYQSSVINPVFAYLFKTTDSLRKIRIFGPLSKIKMNYEMARVYANDKSDDPVIQFIIHLFPSPTGSLNHFANSKTNFGKHFIGMIRSPKKDDRDKALEFLADVFVFVLKTDYNVNIKEQKNPPKPVFFVPDNFKSIFDYIRKTKSSKIFDTKIFNLLSIHAFAISTIEKEEDLSDYLKRIIGKLGNNFFILFPSLKFEMNQVLDKVYEIDQNLKIFPFSFVHQPATNEYVRILQKKKYRSAFILPRKITKTDNFSDIILLNICKILLLNPENNNIDPSILSENSKMKLFFTKYTDLTKVTDEIREEWNIVLQDLERFKKTMSKKPDSERHLIIFNTDKNSNKTIDGGVINIMNSLLKLFEIDHEQFWGSNEVSSQTIGEKLKQLLREIRVKLIKLWKVKISSSETDIEPIESKIGSYDVKVGAFEEVKKDKRSDFHGSVNFVEDINQVNQSGEKKQCVLELEFNCNHAVLQGFEFSFINEESFSDCSDILLLNICNALLFDPKNPTHHFNVSNLNQDSKLAEFYKKYPKIFTVTSEIREDWSRVVQCLSDFKTIDHSEYKTHLIVYKRENQRNEIKSGIINMMNVLIKIFQIDHKTFWNKKITKETIGDLLAKLFKILKAKIGVKNGFKINFDSDAFSENKYPGRKDFKGKFRLEFHSVMEEKEEPKNVQSQLQKSEPLQVESSMNLESHTPKIQSAIPESNKTENPKELILEVEYVSSHGQMYVKKFNANLNFDHPITSAQRQKFIHFLYKKYLQLASGSDLTVNLLSQDQAVIDVPHFIDEIFFFRTIKSKTNRIKTLQDIMRAISISGQHQAVGTLKEITKSILSSFGSQNIDAGSQLRPYMVFIEDLSVENQISCFVQSIVDKNAPDCCRDLWKERLNTSVSQQVVFDFVDLTLDEGHLNQISQWIQNNQKIEKIDFKGLEPTYLPSMMKFFESNDRSQRVTELGLSFNESEIENDIMHLIHRCIKKLRVLKFKKVDDSAKSIISECIENLGKLKSSNFENSNPNEGEDLQNKVDIHSLMSECVGYLSEIKNFKLIKDDEDLKTLENFVNSICECIENLKSFELEKPDFLKHRKLQGSNNISILISHCIENLNKLKNLQSELRNEKNQEKNGIILDLISKCTKNYADFKTLNPKKVGDREKLGNILNLIFNFIGKFSNLKRLKIRNFDLEDYEDLMNLGNFIKTNLTKLESLNLSDTNISSFLPPEFLEMIASNILMTLNLSKNNLNRDGINQILKVLSQKSSSIKNLNFSENNIKRSDQQEIRSDYFESLKKLQSLNFSKNIFKKDELRSIIRSISQSSDFEHLFLSKIELKFDPFKYLGTENALFKNLKTLDISDNEPGSSYKELLIGFQGIENLNISNTGLFELDKEYIKAIINRIFKQKRLKELNMSENYLNDLFSIDFSRFDNLERLDISNMHLVSENFKNGWDSILMMKKLRDIDMSCNYISDNIFEFLNRMKEKKEITLENFDISYNRIHVEKRLDLDNLVKAIKEKFVTLNNIYYDTRIDDFIENDQKAYDFLNRSINYRYQRKNDESLLAQEKKNKMNISDMFSSESYFSENETLGSEIEDQIQPSINSKVEDEGSRLWAGGNEGENYGNDEQENRCLGELIEYDEGTTNIKNNDESSSEEEDDDVSDVLDVSDGSVNIFESTRNDDFEV